MSGLEASVPCEDKLAYETKEAAEGAATYAKYKHGTKLGVYKCSHCSLWHLTSV